MHDLFATTLATLPSAASIGYSLLYLLIGAIAILVLAKAPGG